METPEDVQHAIVNAEPSDRMAAEEQLEEAAARAAQDPHNAVFGGGEDDYADEYEDDQYEDLDLEELADEYVEEGEVQGQYAEAIVHAHPGIQTDAFAERATPLLQAIERDMGADVAYDPRTVYSVFQKLGGDEAFGVAADNEADKQAILDARVDNSLFA